MKRLISVFLSAILLFAGCKPNEPVAETPPQPQQEDTYIEWADNPFWGPISDQLEQMGLLDTWNDRLNANDDELKLPPPDVEIPAGNDIPAKKVDIYEKHQTRLTYVSWGVTAIGLIVDIIDVKLNYGTRATVAAKNAIEILNQALTDFRERANNQKQVQKQLTDRIKLLCQIIDEVCLKEVIRRQEIDNINQLYNYINECHDRGYYNLTFATPYWNEMERINSRYGTEDSTQTMPDDLKRSYYREVYALLSEWAQPDYSNVFEAINYAHYLCSQRGSGMPAIYIEWAKTACMWNFERQDMLTQLASQDFTAMIFMVNLANAYLHACQYLHIGMDIHVTYEVEKQLREQAQETAKVYGSMLNEIKKVKTRQCFIPGAEFVSEDSVLTAIPYQKPQWALNKDYTPELLVYGYNNKKAEDEKKNVISDSIANRIISFYGNRYTLAQVLISQGGFMVPKEHEQTYLSNIEILASGKIKGDVNEGFASIYAPGGFNKAQRADEHLTRWMGTAIINKGKMTGWADFASPSVWMTVHGKIKSKKK